MTKLLIKRFIKDYENTQNSDVRTAYGKFSSIVGIVCNAILFISKLIVGTLSASVSITADAVNNLSDASSSIISLLVLNLQAVRQMKNTLTVTDDMNICRDLWLPYLLW